MKKLCVLPSRFTRAFFSVVIYEQSSSSIQVRFAELDIGLGKNDSSKHSIYPFLPKIWDYPTKLFQALFFGIRFLEFLTEMSFLEKF